MPGWFRATWWESSQRIGENSSMLKFARRAFNQFIDSQSLGGIALALAALLALVISNSPLS